MDPAGLDRAFDGALVVLAGRREYGGAYAERALRDVMLGDQPFIAYFQMNAATGRLQQVLLQHSRRDPTPKTHAAVMRTLRETYGPPSRLCSTRGKAGRPRLAVASWTFPTTTIHATFLDFYSAGLLFEDPNSALDPLQPFHERRLINPRFLPRRVLVRFHDARRTELLPGRDCRPPK